MRGRVLLVAALLLVAACETRMGPGERVVSRKSRVLNVQPGTQNPPQTGRLDREPPRASSTTPGIQKPASLPVSTGVASTPVAPAGVNPNSEASDSTASDAIATPPVSQTPVATTSVSPSVAPSVAPSPMAGLNVVIRQSQSGTWMQWKSLRRPRSGLVAAVVDGTLVAVEGHPRSSQEEWDAEAASWGLREHDGGGAGVTVPAAALRGNDLFLAGGIVVGRANDVTRYGPGTPRAALATLPENRKAAAAGVFDGVLHTFGGETSGGATAHRRRVDLTTGEAAALTGMSYAMAGAASVQQNARLWLLGGYTTDANGVPQAISTVGLYDHATGEVLRSGSGVTGAPPPLPEARHSAAAARLGDRIFVAGGVDASGALLDTVLVLDTAAVVPAWQVLTRLPTPRALLALVVHDGFLLALGGQGADRRPQTRVEAYRL